MGAEERKSPTSAPAWLAADTCGGAAAPACSALTARAARGARSCKQAATPLTGRLTAMRIKRRRHAEAAHLRALVADKARTARSCTPLHARARRIRLALRRGRTQAR
jgi:hypothetical protein